MIGVIQLGSLPNQQGIGFVRAHAFRAKKIIAQVGIKFAEIDDAANPFHNMMPKVGDVFSPWEDPAQADDGDRHFRRSLIGVRNLGIDWRYRFGLAVNLSGYGRCRDRGSDLIGYFQTVDADRCRGIGDQGGQCP